MFKYDEHMVRETEKMLLDMYPKAQPLIDQLKDKGFYTAPSLEIQELQKTKT
jgi:hypothetical protein